MTYRFPKLPNPDTPSSFNLPNAHCSITWTFTWTSQEYLSTSIWCIYPTKKHNISRTKDHTRSNPLSSRFCRNWHNGAFMTFILEITRRWIWSEILATWQLGLQRLRININLHKNRDLFRKVSDYDLSPINNSQMKWREKGLNPSRTRFFRALGHK